MAGESVFTNSREPRDEPRPRLIVWQITSKEGTLAGAHSDNASIEESAEELTTHECLLILDSISRLSKSIVVLTGSDPLLRPDLYEIVEYGYALGLKMVIETPGLSISDDILRKFHTLGPRIFRIVLNDNIMEDMDTRFRISNTFLTIENNVKRLKEAGYEIHFGATVEHPDVRDLAFKLDYAIRHAAKGLYCHLCFRNHNGNSSDPEDELQRQDEMIARISALKKFIPKNMYFSPQCIKYMYHAPEQYSDVEPNNNGDKPASEWVHLCLAGKTFAFINSVGKVQACLGLPFECGDLCENGYDFKMIWQNSELFHQLRSRERTHRDTQSELGKLHEHQSHNV